ncbi:hypothetical protein ES676_02590 [Bizionia saleffrena]|uniref:Uncharacterized protein n=1 Tax=Bizionia saleffrena TaxID=291189 RepID=A0A8H2LH59_9FLAO|nr:hypothetical protein [Bizionia saleffrena]TYB78117.1 hypothetical protein ES676_02590 [Bizionia saleffrena]
MKYKDAFAVNDKHYCETKINSNCETPIYQLHNFDYYEPKLIDDFYLKYFTRQLLIEIDILEVKNFLEYHYDYCDNPDKYFSILDYKIIPKISEIIEHAQVSTEAGGYYDEIKLEDGFVESEGVIHNSKYDYWKLNHYIAFFDLQNDIRKRAEIIKSFLTLHFDNRVEKPLKWIAGSAKLGIIIRELIDMGYMEADKRRGEINCSSLSRDLFKAFKIEDSDSAKALEIYLSSGNKRYLQTKELFDESGFCIPPSSIV